MVLSPSDRVQDVVLHIRVAVPSRPPPCAFNFPACICNLFFVVWNRIPMVVVILSLPMAGIKISDRGTKRYLNLHDINCIWWNPQAYIRNFQNIITHTHAHQQMDARIKLHLFIHTSVIMNSFPMFRRPRDMNERRLQKSDAAASARDKQDMAVSLLQSRSRWHSIQTLNKKSICTSFLICKRWTLQV